MCWGGVGELAHIVIPAEHTPPPASVSAIAVTIRRRGGRGEAGGRKKGEKMKALRSQIREADNPSAQPTCFNIKREYITSCVVLATPEMLFELAESIRRHLCSFGSWKELTGKKRSRGGGASLTPSFQH